MTCRMQAMVFVVMAIAAPGVDAEMRRVIDFGSATAACASLADSGRLRELSDDQLRRAICVTSSAVVESVSQRRAAAETQCMAALEALAREFKSRFPGKPMTPRALGCAEGR